MSPLASLPHLSSPEPAALPGRPLRVVHFISSQHRGGAEEHILGLLRTLDARRFQQILACPPGLAAALAADVPAGARIHPVRLRHFRDAPAALRFAGWLRREQTDIVHCHLFYSSLFATPLARMARVPVVIETPHLREHWRQGWKAHFGLDRIIGRGVSGYIAVSAANGAYLRQVKRFPGRKIHIIPNGVDLARFAPAPAAARAAARHRAALGLDPADPLLLVPGRLEAQKGHAVLLAAMPQLRSAYPRLHAVFAGSGALEPALRAQAAALGLAPVVHFPGHQNDMAAWLAAADVVILPSWFEGLPLAAIEALAAARPLVATAVDGTVEVVRHEQTGLLVAPGDAPALAAAVVRLLADPELARRLGAAGQDWSRQFDIQRQAAATAALYLTLWQHRQQGRREQP